MSVNYQFLNVKTMRPLLLNAVDRYVSRKTREPYSDTTFTSFLQCFQWWMLLLDGQPGATREQQTENLITRLSKDNNLTDDDKDLIRDLCYRKFYVTCWRTIGK